MASSLKSLKLKRGGCRSAVTKYLASIPEYLLKTDVSVIEARLITLGDKRQELNVMNGEIINCIEDEVEMAAEYEGAMDYEQDLLAAIKQLESRVSELKADSVTAESHPDYQEMANSTSRIKLPKISLPKFDGSLLEWTAFWDIFQSTVHDSRLSRVQKFHYLRGQLEGEASQLIEGFSTVGESYDEAINLLRSTYGDEERLKIAHINALVRLMAPNYNVQELSKFRAEIECHTRSLYTLNLSLDEMLVIIIREKLPLAILDKVRSFDLTEFKTQLGIEINNLKLSNNDSGGSLGVAMGGMGKGNTNNPKYNEGTLTMAVGFKGKGKNPPACKLCISPKHKWVKCPKYPTNKQKVGRAKQIGACVSCLSKEHKFNCTADYLRPCRHCRGHHFDALCPAPSGDVADTRTNKVWSQ